MKKTPGWLALLAIFLGFSTPLKAAFEPHAPWTGEPEVEGSVIRFKTPEGSELPGALNTRLFDLKYLGTLPPAAGAKLPYVLVVGRPCDNCENQRGVYMMRVDGQKSSQFVFPGKILDPKTRALLYESRAFWGKCLPQGEVGYIAYQKERVDRRRGMPMSVFIAKPGAQFIEERLIERRLPRIQDALHHVKRKECFEIAGSNRTMMSKKIDIIPKRGADPSLGDAAEEDDTVKENQTEDELPSTGER
jgi:hypothetical protein